MGDAIEGRRRRRIRELEGEDMSESSEEGTVPCVFTLAEWRDVKSDIEQALRRVDLDLLRLFRVKGLQAVARLQAAGKFNAPRIEYIKTPDQYTMFIEQLEEYLKGANIDVQGYYRVDLAPYLEAIQNIYVQAHATDVNQLGLAIPVT